MKHSVPKAVLFSLFFIFLLPCSILAQDNIQQQKDSLLNLIANTKGEEKMLVWDNLVHTIYQTEENIDSVLKYFTFYEKEAENQKNISKQGYIKSFLLNALYNHSRIDLYNERVETYLDFMKENELWSYYYNSQIIRFEIDELRTIYEVDKITAEKEQKHQQVIWAIAVCMLLLVALFIYFLYSRRLKQRNLALYQQVQELSRKEKAVESCFLSKPEETLSKEMQLFRQLSKLMKTEKLFINTEINRKTVANHLGTNENYLASAIRAVRGETFSDYVSNLRLQHALELLNDQPDMTFEAIGIDSGHGSYSQFFRAFNKKIRYQSFGIPQVICNKETPKKLEVCFEF